MMCYRNSHDDDDDDDEDEDEDDDGDASTLWDPMDLAWIPSRWYMFSALCLNPNLVS